MSVVYYNGNEYRSRTPLNEFEGLALASVASATILSPLVYAGKPFAKQLVEEETNNITYKNFLKKALKLSELDDVVKIIPAQFTGRADDYALGKNACYMPHSNEILINTDKISAAGFHEIGHALNNLKSKFGVKYLAKMRAPGYAIAGLMEYFAIFSRTKPKGAPRGISDVIEDNCGKIAFAAMLPVVIEEAIASHRGIKLAQKSGVPEALVKNLKKLYSKALMTYAGRAVLGGLAVFASRKIMDYYTRPKLIETSQRSVNTLG